jgi:type IV pilus assembly protein PilB
VWFSYVVEAQMKLQGNRIESALDAISQVQFAIKSIGVYPEDHPSTASIIHNSYQAVVNQLNSKSVFTVGADGGKLLVDDVPIESRNPVFANFALDLDKRDIGSISFHRGLSWRDYLMFIKAMIQKPASQSKTGDVASLLKSNGISKIQLNKIRYQKVSGDGAVKEGFNDHAVSTGSTDGGYQTPIINNFNIDPEPPTPHEDTVAGEQENPLCENDVRVLSSTEAPPPSPQQELDVQQDEGLLLFDGEKVTEYIENLLSGRKSNNLETIIEDISHKIDDKSVAIREEIARSLQNNTLAIDEFGSLKENFQKISNTLINWVTKENHADTYLAVTKSLQNICSTPSLNKLDSYLCSETIGGRLFENNELSKAGLQEALKARKKNGNSLQYNLAALNLVSESVLTYHLAQQYKNCRTVILSKLSYIPESILKAIPEKYVRRYQVLPFNIESGNLYAATLNPNDWQALKDIRFITSYPIIPHLAAEYYLLSAIEKFYNIKSIKSGNYQTVNKMQQEDWNGDLELVEDKQDDVSYTDELKDSDAPIIKLANGIIEEAIKQKASDIHIEPYEHDMRVRLRIDGTLLTVLDPAKRYANGLVSRIKIMSGLDISERRLPQDGRFKVRKDGKLVDFRVSTFPGIFGEKIVMRLLDNAGLVLDIDKLGFHENDLAVLTTATHKSKGMILVTGPTGSGKTTTLYSILRSLNDGTLNISTAEDPIEYNLKGINQFQMNTKIGLDFARALRSFLRQDPDIIMVGEIRDFETAEIAFRAALTGHLVLSTLHTNNAPETITRLVDIGIEPYIINSSVNIIIAQRLIRKICEKCKVEITPTEMQANTLMGYGFNIDGHKYSTGEGCEECGNTGYKGRIAIYEVLPLWDDIQEAIQQGNSASDIKTRAEAHGFTSLQIQGFNKASQGITSLNEWLRVLA